MISKFTFNSVETHINKQNGVEKQITEAISIRNGKGTKRVIVRENKNKINSSTRKLTSKEIKNIKDNKFMPELFTPCHNDCNMRLGATRKKKKTNK